MPFTHLLKRPRGIEASMYFFYVHLAATICAMINNFEKKYILFFYIVRNEIRTFL